MCRRVLYQKWYNRSTQPDYGSTVFTLERKVRTAERRVLVERLGLCLIEVSVRRHRNLHKTVRATETSWVAPAETAKLLGLILWARPKVKAILPAATGELHCIGSVPVSWKVYFGAISQFRVIRSQAKIDHSLGVLRANQPLNRIRLTGWVKRAIMIVVSIRTTQGKVYDQLMARWIIPPHMANN